MEGERGMVHKPAQNTLERMRGNKGPAVLVTGAMCQPTKVRTQEGDRINCSEFALIKKSSALAKCTSDM